MCNVQCLCYFGPQPILIWSDVMKVKLAITMKWTIFVSSSSFHTTVAWIPSSAAGVHFVIIILQNWFCNNNILWNITSVFLSLYYIFIFLQSIAPIPHIPTTKYTSFSISNSASGTGAVILVNRLYVLGENGVLKLRGNALYQSQF